MAARIKKKRREKRIPADFSEEQRVGIGERKKPFEIEQALRSQS